MARGCGTLLPELPLSVIHEDGTETLGIVDLVAMGDAGIWVIDHKTGRALDPEARFVTYWPQLHAYAEALAAAFPGKQVLGVAVHWMEEGLMTSLPLRQLDDAKLDV
jgi:ATP-dependent exoDNAse (exonuclease V) beta subunit